MKVVVGVLFVVAVSFVTTTVQENVEAVQIVKPNQNCTLQYVKGNKLEAILNSTEIRDRYVAVISIVGLIQSGKSLLLNLFLNYLRNTYEVWSPVKTKSYDSDWTNMNITNGFDTKPNHNGTTKGIWAWPEIFLHDNITYGDESGNKVAIILLDTEGLFHVKTDLRHNTRIFALSTMFSSMQGYNIFKSVYGDTLQFLDIFSTYTVYGSRFMAKPKNESEIPFQDLYFLVRDSIDPNESERNFLKRIFPDDDNTDQSREMKTRLKAVFKKLRAFQLPHVGEGVSKSTFNGDASLVDQRFKDAIATMVPDILAPENIVIKEINGDRVKAKELSHFLKTFTDIVEKNITVAKTLVEVLANASNWMVYQNYLQYYDDLMSANFSERKNASNSYFKEEELLQLHQMNKNASMSQFKNRVKLGGDKLASPFEILLNDTIDEHLKNFREKNINMYAEYRQIQKIKEGGLGWIQMGILVVGIGGVMLFAVAKSLSQRSELFATCKKAKGPNQGVAVTQKTPEKR